MTFTEDELELIESRVTQAFALGVEKGREDELARLRVVASLNGHAPDALGVRKALPHPANDVPDTADDSPHAALTLAMVDVALHFAEHDEDATPALNALADLAEDPAKLEDVLGVHSPVAKSIGAVIFKAKWDDSLHPRDDNGRFVSKEKLQAAKNDPEKAKELRKRVTSPEQRAKLEKVLSGAADPGHTKRSQARADAAERRAKRAESLRVATRLAVRAVTNEAEGHEFAELVDHLPNLTVNQLRDLRSSLAASVPRSARREALIAGLVAHALEEAKNPTRDYGPEPVEPRQIPEGKAEAVEQPDHAKQDMEETPKAKKPWEMTKNEYGLEAPPVHESVAELLKIIADAKNNEGIGKVKNDPRFIHLDQLPVSKKAANELEKRGLIYAMKGKTTPEFGEGLSIAKPGENYHAITITPKGERELENYHKHREYHNAISEAMDAGEGIPSSVLRASPEHLERALKEYTPSNDVPTWGELAESKDGTRGIVKQGDTTIGVPSDRKQVLLAKPDGTSQYETLGTLKKLIPAAKPAAEPKDSDPKNKMSAWIESKGGIDDISHEDISAAQRQGVFTKDEITELRKLKIASEHERQDNELDWKTRDGVKKTAEPKAEPATPPAEKTGQSEAKKEPWEMTKAEHDAALTNLRPNAQGTGGDTRGGMGRATSERGLARRLESIHAERARLLAGLPGSRWVRYDEQDNPYISDTPPKRGDQDFDDAYQTSTTHHAVIEFALSQGKPVPPEVLADYPDLAAKYGAGKTK